MRVDPGFQRLYAREFPRVFRAALLISGSRAVAEDAAQEAFARALERWRRVGGQPWTGAWVTSTAINLVKRMLRRRPPPEGPRPPDQEMEMEVAMRVDLQRALEGLPTRQQQAVVLHYLADLPVEQVARAMGCRSGSVKMHLSRARKALAFALEGASLGR